MLHVTDFFRHTPATKNHVFFRVEKQFHTKKPENDTSVSQSVCMCLRGVV